MRGRTVGRAASVLIVLMVFNAGCGGNSRAKYVPSETMARDALQVVLEKWKSGAQFGPIKSPKGEINVFESRWRDGKKLESFQILEQIKNPDQPEFNVQIQLEGTPQETTKYLVLGLDPLNVFRDEDFKQTQTW